MQAEGSNLFLSITAGGEEDDIVWRTCPLFNTQVKEKTTSVEISPGHHIKREEGKLEHC